MNKILFVVAGCLIVSPAPAAVRLPRILASRMVLQRDSQVTIWGWANAKETVHVTGDWAGAEATVEADQRGHWRAAIKTAGAGGPHRLTISGTNRIELTDVLFGEVWLASGQSNMEMPLIKVSGAYTGIADAAREVAAARHPQIRLFQVGNFSSKTPLDDVQTGISMYGVPVSDCLWHPCSPATIPTFASTAYFFARALQSTLQIPVGIIDASWGGTSAEAWTPQVGLRRLGYSVDLQAAATRPQQPDQKIPTRLYNGMIHPLRNVKIKGAIWYQGEGNVGRADRYRRLFATMIDGWRKAFGYEFPFYFAQIAPFDYGTQNSAFLREAQLQVLSQPKTGMAVTMDIGNLRDIHPKNKQEVGRRLALWALANDYGKDLVYSGPIYREQVLEPGAVRLKFAHLGGGLASRDGLPLSHFEIAGRDRVFHPATAKIDGDELIVCSEKVPRPQAVRYGFGNRVTPNLMNRAGLPASSFRTDG
ncbi:MAG: sialate O-acetylesterase [Planctomycetaceae bacterium]|nr:sialate O-acetylesterase [Planctomycetaceae bacterium]